MFESIYSASFWEKVFVISSSDSPVFHNILSISLAGDWHLGWTQSLGPCFFYSFRPANCMAEKSGSCFFYMDIDINFYLHIKWNNFIRIGLVTVCLFDQFVLASPLGIPIILHWISVVFPVWAFSFFCPLPLYPVLFFSSLLSTSLVRISSVMSLLIIALCTIFF